MSKTRCLGWLLLLVLPVLSCNRRPVETEESGAISVTLLLEGAQVDWAPEGRLGLTDGNGVNLRFQGEVPAAGTFYAYYPYTQTLTQGAPTLPFPPVQAHAPESFDPAADILVSQPLVITAETTQVRVELQRLGAFFQVCLDNRSGLDLSAERIASVTVSTQADLAGTVTLNLADASIAGVSGGQGSITVNLPYGMALDGAVQLGVLPQFLPEGTPISVEVRTDNYTIGRQLNLAADLSIAPGQLVTLPIPFTAADVSYTPAGGTPSYVTQYEVPGLYAQDQERIYALGTDQIISSLDGKDLTYVLMDPDALEQLVISGFSTGAGVGTPLDVTVVWSMGKREILSRTFPWYVLKVTDGKVWLGDAQGNGVILSL